MLTWTYSESNGYYLYAYKKIEYTSLCKELISFKGEVYFGLDISNLDLYSIRFDSILEGTMYDKDIVDDDFINFKLKSHVKRKFIKCCFSKWR